MKVPLLPYAKNFLSCGNSRLRICNASGFSRRRKIPSPVVSRARAGIQVVLISTTVIFVVAGTRVAMPLSPPTRNNYFRRRPRTRLDVHEIRFRV